MAIVQRRRGARGPDEAAEKPPPRPALGNDGDLSRRVHTPKPGPAHSLACHRADICAELSVRRICEVERGVGWIVKWSGGKGRAGEVEVIECWRCGLQLSGGRGVKLAWIEAGAEALEARERGREMSSP